MSSAVAADQASGRLLVRKETHSRRPAESSPDAYVVSGRANPGRERHMAMEQSLILVAIREDLARLEAAAALGPPVDEAALAELYPLLTAA
jgi:hypothetical protein